MTVTILACSNVVTFKLVLNAVFHFKSVGKVKCRNDILREEEKSYSKSTVLKT